MAKMALLKLDKHDPRRELEFEVKCALRLTQQDRIHKLILLSQAMLKLAKQYENRRPYQIIKREVR